MATTYSMGFDPIWYIADNAGLPLAGGYMATFSSLTRTFKAVYHDSSGLNPYAYVSVPHQGSTTGIQFAENGSKGPFFFKFDSTTPHDLYYIEIYDSDGVRIWTIDDYSGEGSGGGSVITTALDLQNLVPNNVMYRNTGPTAFDPSIFSVLAPGANAGLVLTAGPNGLCGPDIVFIKNNSSATDRISFPRFAMGSIDLSEDVTPVDYLHFVCSAAGSGETYKYVQFPITQGVQNLTNQDVTVSVWARCTSGNANITLYWLQYYGEGTGATAKVRTPIQTVTLTSAWQKVPPVQTTVPDTTGNTIGTVPTYNDGLFLQIEFALDAATTIDLTKPCVFLGSIAPEQEYQTYDVIDGVVDNARTGDIKSSLSATTIPGWLPMNDGTIGNPSSNASLRAAEDTFPLFDLLWNVSAINAPMYDSASGIQARGATSIADYVANRQIALTHSLGFLLTGTTPSSNIVAQAYTTSGASNTDLTVTNAAQFGTGTHVVLSGSPPVGLQVGAVYSSIYVSATVMRLALNSENAKAGTAITFTAGVGSGNIQAYVEALGAFTGANSHTQLPSEVALNQVTSNGQLVYANTVGSGSVTLITPTSTSGGSGTNPYLVGNASPNSMDIRQPTTFMNVFIKL